MTILFVIILYYDSNEIRITNHENHIRILAFIVPKLLENLSQIRPKSSPGDTVEAPGTSPGRSRDAVGSILGPMQGPQSLKDNVFGPLGAPKLKSKNFIF